MIELQAHSTVSDGELEPAAVVGAAAAAGVTVLALTDHDAVAGVEEAAAAAARAGLAFVRAVEMSSVHELAEELHVLGYGIDVDALAPACARAQEERVARAVAIVERLRAHGVSVEFEDVVAQAGDAASIGRPHIARAAGAVDMGAFFELYLVPGAKAFVPRRWPTVEESVVLIREAGGVAVLAHPFWDLDDPAVVEALVAEAGFDGVECFYPSFTEEQARFLVDLCTRRGLLVTGSSDFHGPAHKAFPRFGAYRTYGLGEPDIPGLS
jgi:predicted metal-dependent phosphoesterase TrpH